MITLPKPPSINHIYGLSARGGFARSYITKDGQQWFESAALIVSQNNPFPKTYPITESVSLSVTLYTARMQDIDNILKPVLDLLANTCLECHGKYTSRKACYCGKNKSLMQDDRQIMKLFVEKIKVKHVPDEKIEVELTKID